MELHLDDWIQENLFFLGEYETPELLAMDNFLKPSSVFVDIGANIGLYSLYATKTITQAGKIIAFEPFSQNFQTFKRNLELNQFNQITAEKLAIGSERGMLSLHYNTENKNLGMVSANPEAGEVLEEVKILALDDYFTTYPQSSVDFIKIDVEGFEYDVVLGMKETLDKFKPTLLVEILDDTANSVERNCIELLADWGYEKYYIDDMGQITQTPTNPARRNYLFVAKQK